MARASHDWPAAAELGERFSDMRPLRSGARFAVVEARDTDAGRR